MPKLSVAISTLDFGGAEARAAPRSTPDRHPPARDPRRPQVGAAPTDRYQAAIRSTDAHSRSGCVVPRFALGRGLCRARVRAGSTVVLGSGGCRAVLRSADVPR